jgi:hypothetical protein
LEYARFADDLVILVDSHPRQQWLRQAVEKRLREELTKLQVEVNEEKSRTVDLQRGESFGFLGFDRRRKNETDPRQSDQSRHDRADNPGDYRYKFSTADVVRTG